MENQLYRLNCLKSDFKKWADSKDPSTWEMSINEIGGNITGFCSDDDPIILLDYSDSNGRWFLCINKSIDEYENGCYPIEDLSKIQIFEIRRIVESWLVKKDIDFS